MRQGRIAGEFAAACFKRDRFAGRRQCVSEGPTSASFQRGRPARALPDEPGGRTTFLCAGAAPFSPQSRILAARRRPCFSHRPRLATDSFLTLRNLFDLLTSNAFVGILAAGLLVVLVAGGIDISFTATASVAQYVTLTLAHRYGLGWLAIFVIACAVGIACGLINAIFITRVAQHLDHRVDRDAEHLSTAF